MNASSNDYLVLTATFTVFTAIWTFSSSSWGTRKRMVKNEKVRQRMKTYSKVLESMRKYDKVWEGTIKHDKERASMRKYEKRKYDEEWESTNTYEKVRESKYETVWEGTRKLDEVWGSMSKYEKVQVSMRNYKKILGSTRNGYITPSRHAGMCKILAQKY